MNYYMPYFNMYPNSMTSIARAGTSRGLFSRLLGGLNWSSILSNTQKTLGIVNQAIPMVKQLSPMVQNAKTMFKVMNEFKKVETPINDNIVKENTISNEETKTVSIDNVNTNYDGGPTFFIN